MSPLYSDVFYQRTTELARSAARTVCPILHSALKPDSVLDVGCAQGAWLVEWNALGAKVKGLDSSRHEGLLVEDGAFDVANLEDGFSVASRFDLAQCLEVAEHLTPAGGARLIESLAQAADIVVFSAAPPGQGGENHVNERPYTFWRDIWSDQGFAMFDAIRPEIAGHQTIPPWYRFNMFLFANKSGVARLPAHIANTELPMNADVPDVAPRSYRLRRHLVRRLPIGIQNVAARFLANAQAFRGSS
jgi:SAM-dependent methyltransferase